MSRWSFTLQLEFLIKRIEHQEEIYSLNESSVQDRTLYEDLDIFAPYLQKLGNMSAKEFTLYEEYFTRLHKAIPKPNKII